MLSYNKYLIWEMLVTIQKVREKRASGSVTTIKGRRQSLFLLLVLAVDYLVYQARVLGTLF
jgi:hypothetical protein